MITLINDDNINYLKTLEDNSVDSIVTDPPYGISFMNRKWDYDVPSVELWKECLRVLKPGGHLLSFSGTRTQHRMAVRIEDAGFEIRDMIAWVYGSGFPKSLNIGKEVDKLLGNEREIVGTEKIDIGMQSGSMHTGRETEIVERNVTKGNSEWEGWGTALKPALEPITLARKPIEENTIAQNVLKWGTGGINIDGSRVDINKEDKLMLEQKSSKNITGVKSVFGGGIASKPHEQGRFPANLIHDGSEQVLECFPETKSGDLNPHITKSCNVQFNTSTITTSTFRGDSGSASRFFYCAKTSTSERNKGFDDDSIGTVHRCTCGAIAKGHDSSNCPPKTGNNHPTVKPIQLMRYLVRMITPKNGICLDPFMGSGSTGIACKLEGFNFIGIEKEKQYAEIAQKRIDAWEKESEKKTLF